MAVELKCQNCKANFPPSATECKICGTPFTTSLGPTEDGNLDQIEFKIENDYQAPDPFAFPPDLKKYKYNLISLSIALFTLINISYFIFTSKLSSYEYFISKCLSDLNEEYNWKKKPNFSDLQEIDIILVPPNDQYLASQFEKILTKLPFKQVGKENKEFRNRIEIDSAFVFERLQKKKKDILIIKGEKSILNSSLRMNYYQFNFSTNFREPNFTSFVGFSHLFTILLDLALILLLIYLFKYFKFRRIKKYRIEQRLIFDKFQEDRTILMVKLKQNVDRIVEIAKKGEIAKALIEINKVLKLNPQFLEAQDLKKLLQLANKQENQSIKGKEFESIIITNKQENNSLLYLRVLGTPYAYKAPSDLEKITIGRQRRKKNSPGNDVVIRIPGSEIKSRRISRQHLEIIQMNSEFYVIDKSNGRLKLNGKLLKYNVPVRLVSMDRLLISGILTLEVIIRSRLIGNKLGAVLKIDDPDNLEHNFFIEATLGDLRTNISE